MGDANLLERIHDGAENPANLPFALLQKITDNFSEEGKIGQGGFGKVYKGVLGERNVAVKRFYINENTVDDKLFRREVASLWNTTNRNVVRILGVCSEVHHKTMDKDGNLIWADILERLLCFEYISNGSLDKHIADELRGLEWEMRYEIITGICKGLCYLHKEKNIIHMDLKPANILLHQDKEYMVPKITDFGLSRLNDKSHTVSERYGTGGYMAPEYREHGKTTHECDIYSLGTIIIELVTGCKDVPNKYNVLRRWRHRWKKPPTQLQYQQVTRCIDIAGDCRKQDLKDRPSISNIISFLNESGSTYGQIWPCLKEDDMLRINPLELLIPSELKNEISHSVELTNDTLNCMAFNIQLPSAQPLKGIVQPGSTIIVKITVQARDVREHDHGDKFIVQSMKWTEGLGHEDIMKCMSGAEARKVVDEVDLMVLYEPKKHLKNSRSREDTNLPAEEIPEAKKRKTGESSSRESADAVAVSMDINSSMRGQYTKQLDRRNFHPPENFSRTQATNMTYLVRVSDRAMDVTRGAMGSLLHKLGVLHMEFNLEKSVKKDADQLKKMQDVLRMLPDVQQDNLNDMVKRWAGNVREMSYDLEDFVDGFLVHREPDSDGSGVREITHEMSLEKGKSYQLIGDLIKHHISKQVQDSAEQQKEYKVDDIAAKVTTKVCIKDPRSSAVYTDREQLIGIEEQKKKLINLSGEKANKPMLKIVSIFGFGGFGKTALAGAVKEELTGYHLKASVTVGRNPDVKEVLNDIIWKLDPKWEAKNYSEERLQYIVQEKLKEKRYFILIDDVWASMEWNVIRKAFPENKNDSRVMITTRYHDVALACSNYEKEYVYKIEPLSKEDSRRLFFRVTLGPEKDCHITPKKEEISTDILKKCGGMPLAINSIASLLAGEPESTWENVWKSLGALTEGNDVAEGKAVENMKQILDLSYIRLPDHLKTCLLYVCMYPEDREIYKNDLLRQWVAEGFVITNGGPLDAVDVAEEYFKKLINTCMIQPGKLDYNNEVLSCRVHDIVLDHMRSKSSEEKFIHVFDGLKHVSGQIRRVSVQQNGKEDSTILETIKGSLLHARSIVLYRPSLLPQFPKFKYVQVLRLEQNIWPVDLDLTSINSLFLLRYLKVHCPASRLYVLKLPNQIGELQQLETIDVDHCDMLENCPSDLVNLPWLSHLRFSTGLVLPEGIGRLKSLRSLVGAAVFEMSEENIKGLGKLTNLRELVIVRSLCDEVTKVRMEALHSSIRELSSASLRSLSWEDVPNVTMKDFPCWITSTLFPKWTDPRGKKRSSDIQELDLRGCYFERCPKWIGRLHNLCKLSITVNKVALSVSVVAGLPSLSYLIIETGKDKEEKVVIPGTGSEAFKALKALYFHCIKASLTFEVGAMPKLEVLHIKFRYNMDIKFLPRGIQHLPAGTLSQISLSMDLDSEVNGSENWSDDEWDNYYSSDKFREELREHTPKWKPLLESAFQPHHPSANITIDFEELYMRCGSDDVEGDKGVDSEEEDDDDDDNEEEDDDEVSDDEENSAEDVDGVDDEED